MAYDPDFKRISNPIAHLPHKRPGYYADVKASLKRGLNYTNSLNYATRLRQINK